MRILHVISLACIVWTGCAQTTEFTHAINFGAATKVVFRVVDDRGYPVTNALVKAGFYLNGKAGNSVNDYTGPGGLLVAERESVGEINFWINKAGYYETSGRFNFEHNGVKDGRWQPYGMTNTVVLKRKVNPVAMYCKTVSIDIPAKEVDFGFDCMAGDLVEPHGNGQVPDFSLNYALVYDPNNSWNATNHFNFVFGPHDGGIVMEADNGSQMRTLYCAPSDGYTNRVMFFLKSINRMHQEKRVFGGDEYMIFRSRSVVDGHGNVTNAHFGKILGRSFWYGEKSKDGVGGSVTFSYYFNPAPNDRNIEFDGVNNLFYPEWSDNAWPRAP